MGRFLNEKSASRNNNFDFLRFFAASQVILVHTFVLSGNVSGTFWNIFNFLFKNSTNSLGVDIFFVISGFLIMKSRLDNPAVFVYLKKRFLRIVPGLAATILFCVLLIGPLTSSLAIRDYFSSLLSLQPHLPGVLEKNFVPNQINGSLWTLKVEAFAYLLVALVGFLRPSRAGLLLAASFISLFVLDLIMLGRPGYTETRVWHIYLHLSIRCLLLFIAGSLFYLYREKVFLNLFVFLLFFSVMTITQLTGGCGNLIFFLLPYIVLYFAYSKAPFNNFGRFGDFSYGLYIFAFPVQQTLLYYWGGRISNLGFFLLAFSITFILAVISWNLIEKPALRLKNSQPFLLLYKRGIIPK